MKNITIKESNKLKTKIRRKAMNIKITQFVNDGEKMRDFFDLTNEEFLDSRTPI